MPEVYRAPVTFPSLTQVGGVAYATKSALAVTSEGTTGQVLSSAGVGAAPVWVTPGGGGVGTVTSVAMTVPSGLSVAGSPITTAGTLDVTLTGGAVIPVPSALTRVDDTNVTLTLGGSPTTALINATSLTLGWTGQLGLTRGGTAANLTAVNGGAVYSTASALAITAAGTLGQVLTSAGAAAPTWETPTTGTVTSVAMTVPSLLSVSGSPITGSGTFGVTWNAAANGVPYFSALNTLATSSELTFDGVTLKVTDGTGAAEQLRLAFDSSNYMTVSVQSDGTTGFGITGGGTFGFSSPVSLTLPAPVVGGVVFGDNPAGLLTQSAAGSTGQMFMSRGGGGVDPRFSQATYPDTVVAGRLLVASGTNVWAGQAPAALTKTDDTNVTATLGGSASTALVNAASITLGWTGTLAAARLNADVVQSVVNDTNVTGSIAAQALTLGWTGTLAVARGGSGAGTFTANGVLLGNGTSAFAVTAEGATGTILGGVTGSAPVFTATPTVTTSITVPLVIGGTTTTSDLSFKTTSGVGTSGADMHFLVGNNGATEAMTILNSGNVGIGTTAPLVALHLFSGGNGGLIDTAVASTQGPGLIVRKGRGTVTDIRRAKTNDQIGIYNARVAFAVDDATTATYASTNSGRFQFTAAEDATSTGRGAFFQIFTTPIGSAADATERMRVSDVGNIKIAGTVNRATTEGTNHLDIFDGTAPVGTLANGISLYSTAGELRVMDAAGNATLLSPHDENNNWIFDSHVGKGANRTRLIVDMEKMIRFLNQHFGADWIHEVAA